MSTSEQQSKAVHSYSSNEAAAALRQAVACGQIIRITAPFGKSYFVVDKPHGTPGGLEPLQEVVARFNGCYYDAFKVESADVLPGEQFYTFRPKAMEPLSTGRFALMLDMGYELHDKTQLASFDRIVSHLLRECLAKMESDSPRPRSAPAEVAKDALLEAWRVDRAAAASRDHLFAAIVENNIESARAAVRAGADVNYAYRPMMFEAILMLPGGKVFLDRRAVDAILLNGMSAIQLAAALGHGDLCSMLIDAGARVEGPYFFPCHVEQLPGDGSWEIRCAINLAVTKVLSRCLPGYVCLVGPYAGYCFKPIQQPAKSDSHASQKSGCATSVLCCASGIAAAIALLVHFLG